jgi:hypothetical protein
MKLEIRNSKFETNSKLENRREFVHTANNGSPAFISNFEFRISFGFRVSDFGFI